MSERVIVVIDARQDSQPGETRIAIPEASAWYPLLDDFQVVEIFTREVTIG